MIKIYKEDNTIYEIINKNNKNNENNKNGDNCEDKFRDTNIYNDIYTDIIFSDYFF